MAGEVITINIGRCGVQMGHRIWQQYCAEADILSDGSRVSLSDDHTFKTFFSETKDGKYRSRNLMVDTDRNVIQNVKKCAFSAIYDDNCLLFGNESANNNFAKAYHRLGREMMDKINDRLRKLVENCNKLQGFIINHSVGGGTGSGLGSLILERVAVDYKKKSKLGFEVLSSPTMSGCVVDSYNALLATPRLVDHTDVSMIFDNEALYGICREHLNIPKHRWTFSSLNKIISKAVSSTTVSMRFEGESNMNLDEFRVNLVPDPRLHFLISAMAPMTTEKMKETVSNDTQSIADSCYSATGRNFLVRIPEFDSEEDTYLSSMMIYRGSVKRKTAKAAMHWLKTNLRMVNHWIPTGIKVVFNEMPAAKLQDDELAQFERDGTMIGNNVAIGRVFSERIRKKYDMMYSQKAFVHWYVGEGMEEGEFAEAREDLGLLEKDYLNFYWEATDTEADDSDSEY